MVADGQRQEGQGLRTPVPTERLLRRATDQDVEGVHAVIFVDLTTSSPRFYMASSEHTTAGLIEQHCDTWELFD